MSRPISSTRPQSTSTEKLLLCLGVPVNVVQTERTKQNLKAATDLIRDNNVSKDLLVQCAELLLPFSTCPTFLSSWLLILERLSDISKNSDPDIGSIYQRLSDLQTRFFVEDEKQEYLPLSILHRLWLHHPPSLEFIVLSLVNHVTRMESVTAASVTHWIAKCHLAVISRRESAIHHKVISVLSNLHPNNPHVSTMLDVYLQMVDEGGTAKGSGDGS